VREMVRGVSERDGESESERVVRRRLTGSLARLVEGESGEPMPRAPAIQFNRGLIRLLTIQ
jgi:hypothetical protein